LSSGVRHPSADIFSLGLTLYEFATDHHIELPSEGPRWHVLRSGKPPDLSPYRESELMEVIQLMTGPCVGNRPTADSLLENEKVKSAGHGYDLFLQEYILDVEEFDRIEEERFARDRKEDQTPRTGPH
jgi:serine/threonine protein kinase